MNGFQQDRKSDSNTFNGPNFQGNINGLNELYTSKSTNQ